MLICRRVYMRRATSLRSNCLAFSLLRSGQVRGSAAVTHVAGSVPDFASAFASKHFDFISQEQPLYAWWERGGHFQPSADNGQKPFVVPMPPPNVTGRLHMGHALFVALQDCMVRFQRMRGRPTLWLPGTDHAGIATQLLVERQLAKEGTTRQQMGREDFLQRTWSWKSEKGGQITEQMRRLGASADWSRERFTLEPELSTAVAEAFVRLHEKGLIYRGDYLVNWSPGLQTSVSDLEVDHVEELGSLYTFRYALAGVGGEYIPVSTTRPETILGDTAVAVHPDDPRFAAFIGRRVVVPCSGGRTIPVIADDYVDRDFGTGALKITPAHDANDYELGKRHGLPLLNIMNRDATMNISQVTAAMSSDGADVTATGYGTELHSYNGLDRFDCRKKIWQDMQTYGLTISQQPYIHKVPRSQRGGEVIEPLVSTQWFVKTSGMAAKATQAVRDGRMEILPSRFLNTWYSWLNQDTIRPWCISRQLWWGHRIPVWYVEGEDVGKGAGGSEGAPYVVAQSEDDAYVLARKRFGEAVRLRQDEDVLDTWFSSALWPFSTLGWPHSEHVQSGSDFQRFFPTSVMETGYDILFFWVARMVMLSEELLGQAPFRTIYLHGLVRDEHGDKMSKTTGNVIDPLDAMGQYGCDALRYTVITGSPAGLDVNLSLQRIEINRNFVNKLWNIGKYIHASAGPADGSSSVSSEHVQDIVSFGRDGDFPLAERFIISCVHEMIHGVTAAMEAHNYSEAGRLIHSFVWDDFADWYLEVSKTRLEVFAAAPHSHLHDSHININTNISPQRLLAKHTLMYVWDRCLRLLHPFMPYVTEVLWQQLQSSSDSTPPSSLIAASWPLPLQGPSSMDAEGNDKRLVSDAVAVSAFRSLQAVVRSIRNARTAYHVQPSHKIAVTVVVPSEHLKACLLSERASLALLGRVNASEGGLQIFTRSEYYCSRGPGSALDPATYAHVVVEDGGASDATDAASVAAIEIFMPLSSLVDPLAEAARLQVQYSKLEKELVALRAKLTPVFMSKAPGAIVQTLQAQIAEKREQQQVVASGIQKYKQPTISSTNTNTNTTAV